MPLQGEFLADRHRLAIHFHAKILLQKSRVEGMVKIQEKLPARWKTFPPMRRRGREKAQRLHAPCHHASPSDRPDVQAVRSHRSHARNPDPVVSRENVLKHIFIAPRLTSHGTTGQRKRNKLARFFHPKKLQI
jgi:hypothetical protein